MDFQFDSRTLCYIAVIGLLCCIIACLCCGLFAIVACYCFKDHLPCCFSGGNGSGKQKDEDNSPYYPFGGGQPFYLPQNYFCNTGNGEEDTSSAYGCVAAPMSHHLNGHGASASTAGGLAKPGSSKKGKVNPLNL